jgi:hypothetical protein
MNYLAANLVCQFSSGDVEFSKIDMAGGVLLSGRVTAGQEKPVPCICG